MVASFLLLLAASPDMPAVPSVAGLGAPAGDVLSSPASPAGPVGLDFAAALKAAEGLIVAEQLEEARARLLELEESRPQSNQVQFLLALLDRHDGDLESAIVRFREILVREPDAIRVRLELGRTYFELGDHANARRQFQFARAGHIPESVARNIDRYLYSIRELKTFDFGFSLAVSPNSNRNAGPATDTITLYGLPFDLSDDARASSGVGLIGNAQAEWAPRIAKRAKLRIGGQLYRAQYRRSRFNDMTLALHAGPRLNRAKWRFDLLGNFARRWYADRKYSDLAGASAEATHFVTGRFGLGLGASLFRRSYFRNRAQSGLGFSVTGTAFYIPNVTSFARASVQLRRRQARSKALAHDALLVGLNYVRELKGGFTIGLEPTYTRIAYDAPLAAFDERRVDNQFTGKLTLLNRRIDIQGVTPRISFAYTRNNSTIPLYDFTRRVFEFGFTSLF